MCILLLSLSEAGRSWHSRRRLVRLACFELDSVVIASTLLDPHVTSSLFCFCFCFLEHTGWPGPVQSLVLQPRSCVIFTAEAYTQHLHGIDEVEESVVGARCPCVNMQAAGVEAGDIISRQSRTRVSLTFRFVPPLAGEADVANQPSPLKSVRETHTDHDCTDDARFPAADICDTHAAQAVQKGLNRKSNSKIREC